MPKKPTQEQIDARYWRYKKNSVPTDEFAHLNGPVKTTHVNENIKQNPDGTISPVDTTKPSSFTTSLPHPFKCSKCDYTAETAADSRQHWFDEHKG